MELEILGSGTSHGIPVIGCDCPVCASNDSRDNRMRTSAVFRRDDGQTILIDAGPEFRLQALRARIKRIDAVLITHSHADHVHGIDDLRIFTHTSGMRLFAEASNLEDIRDRFSYVFKETQTGGGKPRLSLIPVGMENPGPIDIDGTRIVPIPLMHGIVPVLGWRIGDTAYLTDCNLIPEPSFALLAGVRNLVIGALRLRPHSTHFNFPEAVKAIDRIAPDRAWFIHICHDFSHIQIQEWLKINAPGKKIEPAHDGLRITVR